MAAPVATEDIMLLIVSASHSPSHMRKLYEISTSSNKTWKAFPGGDHNSSVLEDGYFNAIAEFLADVTDTGSKEKVEASQVLLSDSSRRIPEPRP